jgi:tetratricopeptide (TPR) repeat protein
MAKIFISYRREDTAGHARHLFEDLARRYGKKNVFIDVATIEGGERWEDRIDQAVARCDVFLALIGPHWLDIRDAEGHRRLDELDDYVRREVASGLARDTLVLPVLVDGAKMPPAEALPAALRELTGRNAVELSAAHWDDELERLLGLLPPPPRRGLIRAAIAAAAILVLALGGYAAWRTIHRPPARMGGIFNVGILDFGERQNEGETVEDSVEGRWIADRVGEGLGEVRKAVESGGDIQGLVEIRRIPEHPEGATPDEIEASLSSLAGRLGATLMVYGVLDLSNPPYRFTPSLYLTQEFNGGEELTGESAFGRPIQVSLPLDDSGAGVGNRLRLANDLRGRLEALNFFTLGLAYLQIDQPARALELFDRADALRTWKTGRDVLDLFRGSSLLLLGRDSDARAAYQKALDEAGPDDGRALIGLGNVFFKAGRLDRAADLYRRALETKAASPLAHIESKARFNLGLTLSSRAQALQTPCDASEAQTTLAAVVDGYRRAADNQVLRELAFKADYQRGVLSQKCGEARQARPSAARAAFQESLGYLDDALKLVEPRPIEGQPGRLEEHRWQGSRWLARRVLALSQLRLAELGSPDLRSEAISNLEKVTSRFEEKRGDVPAKVAADAYRLLADAVESSDPAAAKRYRALAEGIPRAASS